MSDDAGLLFHDRVFVVGYTGSGKSELINVLFTEVDGVQRVLIDTKDEFSIPDVEPVHGTPSAIDFREPIIHYRDGGGGPAEFQELFTILNARAPLVVCVHELSDMCDNNANLAPPAFKEYAKKGKAHGRGLIGGTQRPVEMPRSSRSEAQHVYYFVPTLDPDDHAVVAKMTQRDPQALADELELAAGLSDNRRWSFVHYDRAQQTLTRYPPLPEHIRSRNMVRRTTLIQ